MRTVNRNGKLFLSMELNLSHKSIIHIINIFNNKKYPRLTTLSRLGFQKYFQAACEAFQSDERGTFSQIYRDFLPPPRRGVHVKSDNTQTIIQHTPLIYSPYACHLLLDFQWLHQFCSVPQSHHVTASHLSPGDIQQSTGGLSERTQGQAKMYS